MTTDPEAARNFYAGLFGWEYEMGDESTGFYAVASLGGYPVAGIGSMMMESEHPPVWTTYLASSKVDATSEAVTEAGGMIIGPPFDVMDFGRMAIAQDPSRGTFGIWQAGSHVGTGRYNEAGTLVWNELLTRDYDRAKDFYAAVFGYTYTELAEASQYSTIEVDGHTVGGLGTLPPEMPPGVPAHWLSYFAVDDVDATVEQAVALGGSVQRAAADMPYGRHAGLADPSGAGFAVIAPAPGPQS
jgi:uncharacterized protein